MRNFKITLSIGLVLIITFASFLPCLKNGFVNWDDDIYVTRNPLIKDLTVKGISKIFSPVSYIDIDPPQHYVPLVFLSYALEYHFFNLNPLAYHATNLILHLLNCLLVFWFIFLISRSVPVALITAILFGVHPLHVESVAWVTERKDVLCALFFLAALTCYIYYLKEGRRLRYYYFIIILFILALLSKPLAIAIPFALLLCDYFVSGRISKNDLSEKTVLFVILLAYLAIYWLHIKAYISPDPASTFLDKVLTANYIIAFSLYKLIVPLKVSCIYPHPMEGGNTLPLIFYLAPLVTITVFCISLFSRKYTKKIILGSLFFLIAIFPYLLTASSRTVVVVADRFSYLPSIGIFFIAAEFVVWLNRTKMKYRPIAVIISTSVLLAAIIALSILTWNRCKVWKDSIILWSDVLKKYPNAVTAYNNRGAELLARKEYEKAYRDFMSALHIAPDSCDTYFNLASLYNSLGNYKEAIRFYNKVIEINPRDLEVYGLMVGIYSKMNNHAEIINISKKIIGNNPNYALGYCYLCGAYGDVGNFEEALKACQKALEINPNLALAHLNLSAAYYYRKQYDLAIKHCDRAIELGYAAPAEFLESLKPYRK